MLTFLYTLPDPWVPEPPRRACFIGLLGLLTPGKETPSAWSLAPNLPGLRRRPFMPAFPLNATSMLITMDSAIPAHRNNSKPGAGLDRKA